jgi:hypothetical protein
MKWKYDEKKCQKKHKKAGLKQLIHMKEAD